jgi:hypothetical protein
MKLKGHHFDTIEVLEAESQDAFRTWQMLWEWCIGVDGDYFKGDGGQ